MSTAAYNHLKSETQLDIKAFPTLEAQDIQQIARIATCESYPKGKFILSFGQRDIDLIVIESGAIDITNPADNDTLIVTHQAGGFVGDIDLLTRRPIIVNAISAGGENGAPTRILRVPGSELRKLLNTVPRIGEKLITAIQARRAALEAIGTLGIGVIGPGDCGDTNRVREFLYKNFVPFHWTNATYEIGARHPHDGYPIVDCGHDKILHRPTLQQLAVEAGVWQGCEIGDVDLGIVGGGPAGIAAAVYAASEGLKTVVLDQLGPGGQAGGSSRIENFIGFPAGLSGADLATRGVLQMLKFGARMIAPVKVERLQPAEDEHQPHLLHLDCGSTIRAHTVLATSGVRWRRLPAKGADRFERAGVYYACTTVEAQLHQGCDVAVVGGGNSAGQAVVFLAETDPSRKVHLLVRKSFDIGMSDYLVQRIRGAANVTVHDGAEIREVCGDRHVESLLVAESQSLPDGPSISLSANAVFVFIGAEPHSGWLPASVKRDEHGYILSGTEAMRSGSWPLRERDPCSLETTLPRVLVGGDLRSGSTKRVGFAVGDGSLAVTCAHKLRTLYPATAQPITI